MHRRNTRGDGQDASPGAQPADDGYVRLFRATYARLVVALTFASDRHAAEDAVQDAFVQALLHWDQVGAYDDPAAWVRRAALNRLSNRRRGIARRDQAVERLSCVGAASADRVVESGELVDLRDALSELPQRERLVVVLHHILDLPVAEVAAELGLPVGTVKSILSRTRHRLRVVLSDGDVGRAVSDAPPLGGGT